MLPSKCMLCRGAGRGSVPVPIKELEGRREVSLEILGSPTEPSHDAAEIKVPW